MKQLPYPKSVKSRKPTPMTMEELERSYKVLSSSDFLRSYLVSVVNDMQRDKSKRIDDVEFFKLLANCLDVLHESVFFMLSDDASLSTTLQDEDFLRKHSDTATAFYVNFSSRNGSDDDDNGHPVNIIRSRPELEDLDLVVREREQEVNDREVMVSYFEDLFRNAFI